VKLIDPDGLFAEPAADLATLMRDWNRELLPDPVTLLAERCRTLAALTGVGETAIWEWGYMERVATGLMLYKLGFDDEAVDMLAVADDVSAAIGSGGLQL